MPTSLVALIISRNEEEIKIMSEEVSLGKPKDYAEYKYTCGLIRGLTRANMNIKELAQHEEEDDDE